jgi:squalene-hopene/tetraprenyl-beta-curcumene cyclase
MKSTMLAQRGLWLAVIAAVLTAGCEGRHREPAVLADDLLAAPTVSRHERIAVGLSAATKFLAARQSGDGAWRSDVYGPFKEGDALTPLVLNALLEAPPAEQNQFATAKATRYLVAMIGDDGTVRLPRNGLAYPTYTAAGAVIALARQRNGQLQLACDAWLKYLRERQLAEPLGWQPDDAFYGGWGYASDVAHKPTQDEMLASLAEPNLSATVFALAAFRAAGIESGAPEMQKGLAFVRRCQNFDSDPTALDPMFDDGGFFFMKGDSVRNKAGVAGKDRWGQDRFASYGSATADGLRALVMCGSSVDEPRVVAACGWLRRHFSAVSHPGGYVKGREVARQAVYFYYCHSLAAALLDVNLSDAPSGVDKIRWAEAIADELLRRQQGDGSWTNTAVDVREDDPLVATSLAASALAMCRRVIVEAPSHGVAPALDR